MFLVSVNPIVSCAPAVLAQAFSFPPLFCAWQCFAVRSLGWVEMTEEELAPGRSSVAVNNCIRQLSYHKNNLHDPMSGGWGEVRTGAQVKMLRVGRAELSRVGLGTAWS